MAGINPEIKEKLLAAGLWRKFCEYRDQMKSSGSTPSAARKLALDKYLPFLPADSDPAGDGGVEIRDSGVDPALYEGRSEASIIEIIQWVARNLENNNPQPAEAPSAEAWGMLKSYSRSDFRKDEFWDKMFSKLIPSKAQLDSRPPEALDDAGVNRIIERLLAIKADAEAQSE